MGRVELPGQFGAVDVMQLEMRDVLRQVNKIGEPINRLFRGPVVNLRADPDVPQLAHWNVSVVVMERLLTTLVTAFIVQFLPQKLHVQIHSSFLDVALGTSFNIQELTDIDCKQHRENAIVMTTDATFEC